MHVMGGLSGFIGTVLIGPRIGLFNKSNSVSYIMDDDVFLQENSEIEKSSGESSSGEDGS